MRFSLSHTVIRSRRSRFSRLLAVTLLAISAPACAFEHPLVGVFPPDESEDQFPLFFLPPVEPVLTVTSGLALRFRADAENLSFTGDRVSGWTNLGTLGGSAAQTTTSLQPRWLAGDFGMGGRSSVHFDGDFDTGTTGNVLSIANIAIRRGTFVTVFYSRVGTNPTRLVYEHSPDTLASDGLYLNTHDNDTINLRRGFPGAIAATQSSRDLAASWGNDGVTRVATHIFNGDHASHRLYLNGVEPTYIPGTFSQNLDTSFTADFYFGGRGNPGSPLFMYGAIGELLFYDRALSDAERQTVECYFGARYAIAIGHSC